MSSCNHDFLSFASCSLQGGYKRPTEEALKAAFLSSDANQRNKKGSKARKVDQTESTHALNLELMPSSTFPAPLVLPGDDLDYDPEYPPQSFQGWTDEPERNEVTSARNTIYVVPNPNASENAAFVNGWTVPQLSTPGKRSAAQAAADGWEDRKSTSPPKPEDVADYLKAFYHGLPVRILKRPTLEFMEWESDEPSKRPSKAKQYSHVGLSTGSELIRIRTRKSPDGLFSHQINLDDLLDAAISVLPKDAYALLLLTNHDIYENDDDDFCCGRAYGGSRVAVISTARYHPALDIKQGQVPLEHTWPSSHCCRYIDGLATGKKLPRGHRSKLQREGDSAMSAAVLTAHEIPLPSSPAELDRLWLSRVCKTASHELGHCFGLDHCTYYACIMQGTASLAEDSRQPPYLCPIDLAKVLAATGADVMERYAALLDVCENWKDDRMFTAFRAWIRVRISELDVVPAKSYSKTT